MAVFGSKKPAEKKGDEPQADMVKTFEALQKTLESLPQMIQQSTAASLRALVEEYEQQGAGQQAPKKEAEPEDEPDLESMDRKQFASYLQKQIGKQLEGLIDPIKKETETVKRSATHDSLRNELKELYAKHNDAPKFVEEMRTIATKRPHLSMEEVYVLARHAAPEKVKELEAEATTKAAEEKNATTARFGGLLPTSGRGANKGGDDEGQKMSREEAAEMAWNETMADIPDSVVGNA